MNSRFEDMSIRLADHQQSRHEYSQTTLPGFHTVAAIAGQGQVPRVREPLNSYSGLSASNQPYPRQSPQFSAAHDPQAFTVYRQPHAYASIESTPTTAYSSPQTAYSDHLYEKSSVSSISRESSARPHASISSSATVTQSTRSTCAKRNSESQGSDSHRETKRASQSRSQSDESDSEDQHPCKKCKVPFAQCRNRKVHMRQKDKIVKEKSARSEQSKVLQNMEDLLDIVCDWRSPKEQMPGNQRKSGLQWDKQHDILATDLIANAALRKIASNGDLEVFLDEVRPIMDAYITSDSSKDLPPGSLLAANSPSEERRCTDDPNHRTCDNAIDCRKTTRRMQGQANLARIMGVPAASVHARRPSAGARPRPSSSRRR